MPRLRPSLDRFGHVHLFEPVVPARLAAELSDGERAELRTSFAQTVASFRRTRNILNVVALAAVLASWIAVRYLHDDGGISWAVSFAVVCVAIFMANRMPKCPSCDHRLGGALGRFCPNCGADGLSAGKLQAPRCAACGTFISGRRGKRFYKVRACTACGLIVDEAGL